MKIHSDVLTEDDYHHAAKRAGVLIVKFAPLGSKTRKSAFDVALSGRGVRGGMYGNLGYKTALWDEWGIVLGHLFRVDPNAKINGVYESGEHFAWATGHRFDTLTPDQVHLRHNWLSGDRGGPSITGSYYFRSCQCGAVHRFMAHGRKFSEWSVNA
jgi:hypothetical protein